MAPVLRVPRSDDALPSHPGEPYTYPTSRVPDREITDTGVMQHIGPRWTLSVSETASTGTCTLVLDDVAHTVSVSTPVEFVDNGTTHAPTTAPSSGINGTYVYTFTKDPKHNTIISPVIHLIDGTDIKPGSETFDIDDAANVKSITPTITGTSDKFTVQFDTDTASGTNKGQYSLDSGATWTVFDVGSDKIGTFTLTMTGTEQAVLVRGLDSSGNPGPAVATSVPGNSSSLYVFMQIGDTSAEITWAGVGVELSIDAGDYGAPPSDEDTGLPLNQIIVTRTSAHHVYAFRSSVGGTYSSNTVIVPALEDSSGGMFSGLSNTLADETANTVTFSWAWSGDPSATYAVYVADGDGIYVRVAVTSSTSYTFTSSHDIADSHGADTVDIGFYVQAIFGGTTLGPASIDTVTTYTLS